MSAPRPILPGTTYLITRRCVQRQFLLRPSAQVNRIFRFCLAMAANRTGIDLHAYCVLANHYHLVLTDPAGRLPEFMHWLNEYVAKCVNAELGRWESFWAPGSYSAVRLVGQEDLIGKLVYLYTNPVKAGLVRTAAQWPGARSLPQDIGAAAETLERAEGFFRENGPVPETTELRLVMPPGVEQTAEGFLAGLMALVAERERELRAEAKARGAGFVGRRRILAQSPWQRPRTRESRRGLNPRIACRDKWRRIEVLQRLKGFLEAYRDARRCYLGGERGVLFPLGTYWMRVRLGVQCCGGP